MDTLKEIIKDIIAPVLPSITAITIALVSAVKNAGQSKKIDELENKIRLLAEFKLVNGVYFDKEGNPFCPACHGNGKIMALTEVPTYENCCQYICPSCGVAINYSKK